jgi:hypothetical protein
VIESSRKIINQLEMDDEIGNMIHKNIKSKSKEQTQNTLERFT